MTKKKKMLAPFIWHPIETAPEDIDIIVAYDSKMIVFIEADSNCGYDWKPYDGKREPPLHKPTHWMRVEAPK